MKLKLIPKHQNGYKIQKGDTLSSIAKKFGTTVQNLVAINKIKDPNKIFAGQTIQYSAIPYAPATKPTYEVVVPKNIYESGIATPLDIPSWDNYTTTSNIINNNYEVKKGDTLSKIASKYGIPLKELIRINNISNPDKIFIGQNLKFR